MVFLKRFLLVFFVLSLFLGITSDVRAQAGPASPVDGNAVLGDISLRGNSWHHLGTTVNVSTDVSAGFFIGGNQYNPDGIFYGTGGWVNPGGSYTSHTWTSAGAFTIGIYKVYEGVTYTYSKTIRVSQAGVVLSGVEANLGSPSVSVSYSGICGLKAVFSQNSTGVGGTTYFSINTNTANWYNNYIGEPGGLEMSPGFSAFLVNNTVSINGGNAATINFAQANQQPNSVVFALSAGSFVTSAYFRVQSVTVYPGCPGSPPPTPVAPTSAPTSTPAPRCDSTCGSACGVRLSNGTCVNDWGNSGYDLSCCYLGCVGSPATCQWITPCLTSECHYACATCSTSPTPVPVSTSTPVPGSPTPTSVVSTPTSVPSTPTPTPTRGVRNHSCDPLFLNETTGERVTKFSVTVTDPDSSPTNDEIQEVKLQFRGVGSTGLSLNYMMTPLSFTASGDYGTKVSLVGSTATTSGTSKIVTFAVTFTDLNGWGSQSVDGYDLYVYAEDKYGAVLTGGSGGWLSMNRQFRVWDCEVEVVGSIYDYSVEGIAACPDTGYSNKVMDKTGFEGLLYRTSLGDRTMTVTEPSDYASNSPNHLSFGYEYTPIFDPTLNGSNPTGGSAKVEDINGGGAVRCIAANFLNVGSSIVNPYQSDPKIRVDFTTLANQDPWFQVAGGGVGAVNSIANSVPLTCASDPNPINPCVPAMAIGNSNGTNGLVVAPVLNNDSGCYSPSCKYGISNDWGLLSNIIGEKYNYRYFVDNYLVRAGIGKSVSGGNYSGLGLSVDDGVVYVNGDLVLDENIDVSSPGFFMVIVSGKITVRESVDNLDGVFVSDGDFETVGISANQLIINGLVYSPSGDVRLMRGYETELMNNTSPATLINYRPDFIFNMPTSLTKSLFNWREGR